MTWAQMAMAIANMTRLMTTNVATIHVSALLPALPIVVEVSTTTTIDNDHNEER